MRKSNLRGSIILLVTAFIWGVAFVSQVEGMNHVEPFTFNAIRMLIGGIVLLPAIWLFDRRRAASGGTAYRWDRQTVTSGIICGVLLFAASTLQQFGLAVCGDDEAAAGRAGFITALYVIIVPIIGLILRRRPEPIVWVAAVIAVVGMYLLCMSGGVSLTLSDLLLLLCAVGFSLHITVLDRVAPSVDGVRLSCVQFFTTGVLSSVCMLIFETPTVSGITAAWLPILYAGVLSSGVAYTLQVIGQRDTDPTVASIVMSLESVFAALAGWALLGERMSAREIIGCALMFAAIVIAQLPSQKKKSKKAAF